jgi:Bacterial Ig-like domain (group 3)
MNSIGLRIQVWFTLSMTGLLLCPNITLAASQSITVTQHAPASAAYNSTFTVDATTSSGLQAAITSSGSCSGSGYTGKGILTTITMTSTTGTCTVHYNQVGDMTYDPAPEVTDTTTATAIPGAQSITVTQHAPTSAAYNSHLPVSATASSGLPVAITSSGSCSGSGSNSAIITINSGSGTCTVQYDQSGDVVTTAAPTVTELTGATMSTSTTSYPVSTTTASASGLPAVFSVTVSSTAGTPTGSVDFRDGSTNCLDGTSIGTSPLTSGKTSLSTSSLPVGSHTVMACYSGDGNFSNSSASHTHIIFTPVISYVKPSGLISGACNSWANACDLQYALTNAQLGTEIWAAVGSYKPTAGTDQNASFQLKLGVSLYGGFVGTETDRSQRDWTVNTTTLTGDLLGNGNGSALNPGHSYHVVTVTNDSDGSTVLDGVTVSGGGGGGGINGGGMYIGSGSPTVSNATITGNFANNGAGMYINFGAPYLLNVVFSANQASTAGGGLASTGNPTMVNVTFNGNTAASNSSSGGGMYAAGGSGALLNVTFSNNIVFSYSYPAAGGGLYDIAGLTLTNVTFSGNVAQTYLSDVSWGGGYYGNGTLTNVIFNNNTCSYGGGTPCATPDVYGAGAVTYSIIPGGHAGVGNIDGNALLLPLADNGGAVPTMAVQAGSPAIDSGNPVVCPATDARGLTRPQGAGCDMGAYEYYVAAAQTITVTQHAPASAAFNSQFAASATASSNLPVAITSSGSCSGSGNGSAVITMTNGSGTCTVSYNQAGNLYFNSAPTVTETTAAYMSHSLSVAVSGTGTVTSSSTTTGIPSDITCTVGTCSASYPSGSTVYLTAAPPWYSMVGWSGCAASGKNCSIKLDADNNVSATFTQNQNVMLSSSPYATLQDAYGFCNPSGTLLARDSSAVTFLEKLDFNKNYTVTLKGGMDATFQTTIGFTLIQGILKISAGKVIANYIKLQPQ